MCSEIHKLLFNLLHLLQFQYDYNMFHLSEMRLFWSTCLADLSIISLPTDHNMLFASTHMCTFYLIYMQVDIDPVQYISLVIIHLLHIYL